MKNTFFRILLFFALAFTVISLATHNSITLMIATIIMAICVVLRFMKRKEQIQIC